jgi:DNA-binding NarL/FixJ family response regulator
MRMSKPLTPQELWVLYYLHNGLSNPLIASAMELSKNTVKVHKSNLYKKLNLLNLGKEEALKQLQKFVKDFPDLLDNLFPVDAIH